MQPPSAANATSSWVRFTRARDWQTLEDRGSCLRLPRSFNRPDLADDRTGPIRVTFTAGYGDPEDVPATLRAALQLIVAHLYENREAVVVGVGVDARDLPMGVDTLIAPFRRLSV